MEVPYGTCLDDLAKLFLPDLPHTVDLGSILLIKRGWRKALYFIQWGVGIMTGGVGEMLGVTVQNSQEALF